MTWEKKLVAEFVNFMGIRQTEFHEWKFRMCLHTHFKFELVKCTSSLSHKIFTNPTQNVFYDKIENQSFRCFYHFYLLAFTIREVKFKRVLRVQFWQIFQNKILPLSYSGIPKRSIYDYPSIESSNFLLWYEKKIDCWICKFYGK